jgi:hypothetical protein
MGRSEGVEGVAVQGPRDMAKAILLEAQTPAMKGTSPDTTPAVGATGIGRLRFFVSTLPAGGRQATSLFKGTDGPPTSRSIRPAQGEFGMAYRARAPWPRSVRSSRRSHDRPGSPGKPEHRAKGHRCQQIDRNGMVREMRDAETVLEIVHDTGEPSAVNAARSVREGADGKGPEPWAPRRRPTSHQVRFGGGPSEKDQLNWHLAGGLPYCTHGSEGAPAQQCVGATRLRLQR